MNGLRVLGVVAFAVPFAAHASMIDQQNTAYNLNFGAGGSVGQRVTPALSSIDFASFC